MKEKINAIIIGEGSDKFYESCMLKDSINFIPLKNDNKIEQILDKERIIDAIITIGDVEQYKKLYEMPFEIRKRWFHFDNPTIEDIESSIVGTFLENNGRDNGENKLFSIFTCAYKTSKTKADRLYKSLRKQTYTNWNWWIIDDSPEGEESYFTKIKDPRITIIRNITNHGSIGFNKYVIAMACNGDYLVEVDHDDELTSDCLSTLYNAFAEYPDAKFAYSDTLEMVGNHISVAYPDGFSYGQGVYKEEMVNGWNYKIAVTAPSINAKSIRGIHAQPNHVRCWEKNFYHSIGGHNIDLSVCDDMDILVRTFLNTKMIHINKVLYIQYEDGTNRELNCENTQGKRFFIIQQVNSMLKSKYDKAVHNRIIEMGYDDNIWDADKEAGDLYMKDFVPIDYGYQY